MKITKNSFIRFLLICLYIALLLSMISLINYTHNIRFYGFYFLSLTNNICLLFFLNRKEKHYILKICIMNLLYGLSIFIAGNFNSFILETLDDKLKTILFYLFQYFLTANWLLPFFKLKGQ